MPNARFNTMLHQHSKAFREIFIDASKQLFQRPSADGENRLIHPGEFGALRELVVRQFLRPLTPPRFAIASGFIVTAKNETSTQCDVLVFDPEGCPFSDQSELGPFYPIESVVAVGEVKSVLTTSTYAAALEKLEENEKLFDDRPFTFMIFDYFHSAAGKEPLDPEKGPSTGSEHALLNAAMKLQTKGTGRAERAHLSLRQGLLTFEPPRMVLPGAQTGHIKNFAVMYHEAVARRHPRRTNLSDYVQTHSNDLVLTLPDQEP